MNYLLHVLVLLGLIGVSKAHHFIKLVILAGLGLAGLWMVHTLAQDYGNLSHGGGGGGGGGHKAFEKRSIDVSDNFRPVSLLMMMLRFPEPDFKIYIYDFFFTYINAKVEIITDQDCTNFYVFFYRPVVA